MQHLRQRGEDGYPVGADAIMREGYGMIPDAERFQNPRAGYEKPVAVHGWQWSTTFGSWAALVTFQDGWHGYTWPEPEWTVMFEVHDRDKGLQAAYSREQDIPEPHLSAYLNLINQGVVSMDMENATYRLRSRHE